MFDSKSLKWYSKDTGYYIGIYTYRYSENRIRIEFIIKQISNHIIGTYRKILTCRPIILYLRVYCYRYIISRLFTKYFMTLWWPCCNLYFISIQFHTTLRRSILSKILLIRLKTTNYTQFYGLDLHEHIMILIF